MPRAEPQGATASVNSRNCCWRGNEIRNKTVSPGWWKVPKEAFCCCFLRGQLGVRALSLLWWLLFSYFSWINTPFSGLAKRKKKCPKCSGKKCANIVRKFICQDYGLGGVCVYFLYFSRFWQWACTFLKLFLLTARTTSTSIILDLGPAAYPHGPNPRVTSNWYCAGIFMFFTGGKTLMVEIQTSEDLWGDLFLAKATELLLKSPHVHTPSSEIQRESPGMFQWPWVLVRD